MSKICNRLIVVDMRRGDISKLLREHKHAYVQSSVVLGDGAIAAIEEARGTTNLVHLLVPIPIPNLAPPLRVPTQFKLRNCSAGWAFFVRGIKTAGSGTEATVGALNIVATTRHYFGMHERQVQIALVGQ